MQKGFRFETDKCVGCHACIVACGIENDTAPGFNFRSVLTYNPSIMSEIKHYHLSMACNHCLSPPCVENCPAGAITRDTENGSVRINEKLCIGCSYCTWVCPYDAPVLSPEKGVMTKCDMCAERREEGLNPACVTVCPTGALTFEDMNPEEASQEIPFIPDTPYEPALIAEAPGKIESLSIQYINTYPDEMIKMYAGDPEKREQKISAKKEWPLLLFTLLISFLGALLGGNFLSGIPLDPVVFGIAGTAGIAVTLAHLGKKLRFVNMIKNIRSSWLSREAFFFPVFLFFSMLQLYGIFKPFSGIIALGFSLLTALSGDMLYLRIFTLRKKAVHSSQITLTLLFILTLLTGYVPGIIFFSLVKSSLYIKRKAGKKICLFSCYIRAFWRITAGILLPSVCIIFFPEVSIVLILIIVLSGELTDRWEFYNELDVITPGILMDQILKDDLAGRTEPEK
ncbi:MAG: 4Fe-4S dicluster domain-containing protein [Acidobacteriota bacterium]